jgi:hypothetical protein
MLRTVGDPPVGNMGGEAPAQGDERRPAMMQGAAASSTSPGGIRRVPIVLAADARPEVKHADAQPGVGRRDRSLETRRTGPDDRDVDLIPHAV